MIACGAKTRGGGTCKKPPLKGKKRCKLHGGATPSGPASVHYKHGRYATVWQGTLAKKFENATADDKPLDLLPELAVQRTILAQYIEKMSGKTNPTVDSFKAVSALAEDVVRTAATIAKVRNDTALTVAEIRFIQAGMVRLLEKYVTDPDRRRDFIYELRGLVPGRDGASEDGAETIPAITETTGSTA